MCPDRETIERFVMGSLDDAALGAHVSSCETCARILQEEAAREVMMMSVRRRAAASAAPAPAPSAAPRRARVFVLRSVLAVAAAAALVLVAGQRLRLARQAGDRAAAVQVVSCPDGNRQIACIAEAHRSGSRIEYPTTALAELGSRPGLTTHVEASGSDGARPDLERYLARAKADLEACAATKIVTQSAPIQTGELGLRFTITPEGTVDEADGSIVIHAPGPVDVDARDPAVALDLEMASCLRKSTRAHRFDRGPRPVRMSLDAKYVWRE